MPKETFWNSATAVENDGVSEPVITVTWGADSSGVYINGVLFDASGIDRLQTTLRRAKAKTGDARQVPRFSADGSGVEWVPSDLEDDNFKLLGNIIRDFNERLTRLETRD